jgi:hypothetical protein
MSVPRPTGETNVRDHDRFAKVEVTGAVTGTTLDISVNRPRECQKETSTSTVQDVDIIRSVSRAVQAGNLVGFGVLSIGGAAYIGEDPHAPTAIGVGTTLIAVGTVFLAAFISNALRPHDSRETVPGQPLKTTTPWTPCGVEPVTSLELVVTLGTIELRAPTGSDGHALFDLSSVRPTSELVHSPIAEVRAVSLAHVSASIDLSGSDLFAKWQSSRP